MVKTIVRKHSKVQYLLFFSFLFILTAQGQQGKGYAVHANIIYHFTKYIDWPEHMKSGDFIIGVIGESPLYDELKKVTNNKTVGNQKIVIRQYSASESSYHCHILFIGDDETGNLKKILAHTTGMAILIVTEAEGAARKGSCINFAEIDDRLRLEINKTNIEKRNMNIATELLQLGTVIK
jgi:hypothetical protein